jgi:hypothetical protein
MAYQNAIVRCKKCKNYMIVVTYDGKLDDPLEDYKNCQCIDSEFELVEWEDITEVQALIQIAENELENANFHSQISLPQEIWFGIVSYIDYPYRSEVARKIAEVFIDSI